MADKSAAKSAAKKGNAKSATAKKPKVKAEGQRETDLVRRVTWDRMAKKALPQIQTGDTVGVYVKVKEGEKERVQLFTGVIIKIQNSGMGASFTVRKIASGVGVERTFPLVSPVIDRVELISRGKVRRSRLFFLRGLKGRSARLNTEVYYGEGGAAAPGAADEAAVETAEGAVAVEAKTATEAKVATEKKAEKAEKAKAKSDKK